MAGPVLCKEGSHMENLGSYLKREREFRQIQLIEIAEATRISARNLQALEEERFEELPGKAFVRGYLKSYARHVGLDVADVLLRYENLLALGPKEAETETDQAPQRQRRWPWRLLSVAAAAIILIAVAVYFTLR